MGRALGLGVPDFFFLAPDPPAWPVASSPPPHAVSPIAAAAPAPSPIIPRRLMFPMGRPLDLAALSFRSADSQLTQG
ncbi:hypothetical protein GCM10018782_30210 [Streptomyces griseoaurantiacus]|nr:hypothetical protein GCM10018782_30210 [Streptomyces griseoaurantiacus]